MEKTPPRVLVAPQELKGTLSSQQAVDAMLAGLRQARPTWELQLLPLADGGPGTVNLVLRRIPSAIARTCAVVGPLGAPVEATWAFVPPELAIIEMCAASGLHLVPADQRAPLDATTFGVGQLIRAALESGCRRIVVGAGGSGTNDGGLGALRALGVRFLTARGADITRPGELADLESIDTSRLDPRLAHLALEAWTDVRSPLVGKEGATRVFAPQKGASPADVETLERGLEQLAAVVAKRQALELAARPGMGAAGGLAFGLAAVCDAVVRPGFLSLAALLALDVLIDRCDLVLTGEGRLDLQTTLEKGPWALARLARRRGKRVVAFVGGCSLGPDTWRTRFDEVVVLGASSDPSQALTRAVADWSAGSPPTSEAGVPKD